MTSRPNFYLCFSPDIGLIQEEVQKILETFNLTNWKKKVFWAEELEENFWSTFTSSSLFGPGQIIWVRKAENLEVSFWQEAKKYLLSKRSSTFSIFCFEASWNKKRLPPIPSWFNKHPVYQLAKKQKWIFAAPELKENQKRAFILEKIKAAQKEISPPLLNQLLPLLPDDTKALMQELEKIILISEQKIQEKDFSLLNTFSEEDVYQLFNSLLNKDYPNLWRNLQEQTKAKELIFPLLGLLRREAKVLWLLYYNQDNEVNMPVFIKQKKKFLAQKLGVSRIAALLDLVLICEFKIKSGESSPEETFDYLLLSLSRLF